MILVNKLKYYFSQNNTVRQTIYKNTFWLFLAESFVNGSRFLIQLLLARELGISGYGLFSFVLSFASIFMFISDFGFPVLVLRKISHDKSRSKEYFDNIIFVKFLLGLVAFSIIVFFSQILIIDKSIQVLVFLAGISVIINTFSDFIRAFFRAFEKMQWEAVSKIAEGIFLVIIIGFIILNRGTDLREIFYGYIFIGILVFIFNMAVLAKKIFRGKLFTKFRPDYKNIKLILKEGWPLTFIAISVSVYYYIDQIMIGLISSKMDLGYYSAAQKIIHILSMFNYVIVISFLPKIAYYFKEDKQQLQVLLNKLSKLMLIIAIPLGVIGTIFASEIIIFAFGNEYSRAIFSFQILIWAQITIFVSAQYTNTSIMCDRQKDVMYGIGLGAILNIILNYILIIKYSIYGASIATVITQVVILVYIYNVVNKKIVEIKFYKYLFKPVLASLAMFIFFIYLRTNLNFFILIFLGVIFYIFMLFKILKLKI